MENGTNKRRSNMRCPNLLVADTPRCVTVDDSYSPSYFQLREYCGGRYAVCPFYVGYHRKKPLCGNAAASAAPAEAMLARR